MKRNYLFAIVVIVIVVCGGFVGSLAVEQNSNLVSLLGQNPSYTLNLVIKDAWYNSTLGYQPAYFVLQNGQLESSASINLPVHKEIRINIVSYDTMISPPFYSSYAEVSGTVDGLMEVTSANSTVNTSFAADLSHVASAVSYAKVTHTFTISISGQTVNIPVQAGYNDTAFFEINQPGNYTWGCMCPCGQGPMETPGWMIGEVVAS